MNLGSILGSISPAAGIASGQGLFGKIAPFMSPALGLAKGLGGHGGGGDQPDTMGAIAPPTVATNAAPPAPPTGKQPGPPVMKPIAQPGQPPQPDQTGGLHGVAFGGKPNLQGILASLQMMAPGQRRF